MSFYVARMKRVSLFLCWFIALAPLQLFAAPVQVFVAPNGNDAWSGRLAERQANDGPVATLPAALKIARTARANAPDGVTIFMRGGMYALAEPIVITPEDSGTGPKSLTTIAAYQNEKPILSGGRRITGWTPVPGKAGLWQAEIPSARDGKWYFRQLFVNGQRKQRARSPNQGFYRIIGGSPQTQPVQFKFRPGDIKKEWAADGEVEVIALLAWADLRMQIRAVNEASNTVTLSGNPSRSNQEKDAQYWVENAPDALDQAGEWYLDRKAGRLTYWAEAGEDITQAEVMAPALQDLLILKGDTAANKPVQYVSFQGLTFCHTDYNLPANGYADVQAAITIHGELLAEGAVDCRIEDCAFTHLAGYAVELGRGCKRWRIVGNEMSDLGAGGIRVGETAVHRADADLNQGHVITDNHIHHLGEIFAPGIGVLILQSAQNRVAYNHIHDLYYTAISAGWTWGYSTSPCRENIIEFNHLHDIGKARLSDMGAVYTLGPQPGTIIRNNVVHDVDSFTYGGWGLYTDEGSTGIVLENNVVYRTKSAGFHQHYGKENILRNNIFAFGRESQLMRTRPEPHTSFIFTNNIVYFDSGNLLGSNWDGDHYVIDGNLYFDARPGASLAAMKFSKGNIEAWRLRGHDTNSIFADPMFVAPEKYAFTLKPGSPALKRGFKPIDISRVGIRPKGERNNP